MTISTANPIPHNQLSAWGTTTNSISKAHKSVCQTLPLSAELWHGCFHMLLWLFSYTNLSLSCTHISLTLLLRYKCTLFSNFIRTLSRIKIMQIPSKIYIFYYIKYKPCKPSTLVARINYARIVVASLRLRLASQPNSQTTSKLQLSVRQFLPAFFYHFHFFIYCGSSFFICLSFCFFTILCAVLALYFLTQLTFLPLDKFLWSKLCRLTRLC